LTIQGEFSARLTERVLQDVQIDAAVFSEPIGGNHGPLISPQMYQEFMHPSFEPVLDVLRKFGVENIIYRTYANTRILIPGIMDLGFNCLWAVERNNQEMDYIELRREFGPRLRLIGGIDRDVLRHDKGGIRRELEEKVPPLLAEGGYIPLADGRIREDVPFENYLFYRRLLEQVVQN
jgi:uroporphyrinogen decarboxylase